MILWTTDSDTLFVFFAMPNAIYLYMYIYVTRGHDHVSFRKGYDYNAKDHNIDVCAQSLLARNNLLLVQP